MPNLVLILVLVGQTIELKKKQNKKKTIEVIETGK